VQDEISKLFPDYYVDKISQGWQGVRRGCRLVSFAVAACASGIVSERSFIYCYEAIRTLIKFSCRVLDPLGKWSGYSLNIREPNMLERVQTEIRIV
jgi:hypothetical protein